MDLGIDCSMGNIACLIKFKQTDYLLFESSKRLAMFSHTWICNTDNLGLTYATYFTIVSILYILVAAYILLVCTSSI